MLAHHYGAALDYQRGFGESPAELSGKACTALTQAGHHAVALQLTAKAADFYRAARDIASTPVDRATLHYWYASAVVASTGAGREELMEAHQELLAVGRPDLAAEADVLLAELAYDSLNVASALLHWRRAVSLVAPLPASRTKAAVLALSHHMALSAADLKEAALRAQEALGVAEQVGAVELQARALCTLGLVQLLEGDTAGYQVVEESYRLVRSTDVLAEQLRIGIAVADTARRSGQLARSLMLHRELLQTAEQFGHLGRAAWLQSECAIDAYFQGDWNASEQMIGKYFDDLSRSGHHIMEVECRIPQGRIRLARGDHQGALRDAELALAAARLSTDPQDLLPALAFHGHAALRQGDSAGQASIDELLDRISDGVVLWVTWALPDLIASAAAANASDELAEIIRRAQPASLWVDAARASSYGDFGAACKIYRRIGSLPDEASARLEAGRQLIKMGKQAEGQDQVKQALTFWRRVDATGYIHDCEALLAQAESA